MNSRDIEEYQDRCTRFNLIFDLACLSPNLHLPCASFSFYSGQVKKVLVFIFDSEEKKRWSRPAGLIHKLRLCVDVQVGEDNMY